jgi:hypothetical protein
MNTIITVEFLKNGHDVKFNQLAGLSPGHLERCFHAIQKSFHLANVTAQKNRAGVEQKARKDKEQKRLAAVALKRTADMNKAAAEAAKALLPEKEE